VLGDEAGGHEQGHAEDYYAKVPIDARRLTWYWRLRLGFAAGPLVLLMAQDVSPFVLWLLGFGTCAGVVGLGSWLARIDARAKRIRAARDRG